MLVRVEIEEIEIVFRFGLKLGRLIRGVQEIEISPEFMEKVCGAMFGSRVGAFLLMVDHQISERKHVILLFDLALLAEFKEHWILTLFG